LESSDVTASQADEIYKRLRPASDYLAALERRMLGRQFGADNNNTLSNRHFNNREDSEWPQATV